MNAEYIRWTFNWNMILMTDVLNYADIKIIFVFWIIYSILLIDIMRRNWLWLTLKTSILNSSNFFFEMILIFRVRIISILRWRGVPHVRSITWSISRNSCQNFQLNSFDITDKTGKIPSDEFRTTGDVKKKATWYTVTSAITHFELSTNSSFIFLKIRARKSANCSTRVEHVTSNQTYVLTVYQKYMTATISSRQIIKSSYSKTKRDSVPTTRLLYRTTFLNDLIRRK